MRPGAIVHLEFVVVVRRRHRYPSWSDLSSRLNSSKSVSPSPSVYDFSFSPRRRDTCLRSFEVGRRAHAVQRDAPARRRVSGVFLEVHFAARRRRRPESFAVVDGRVGAQGLLRTVSQGIAVCVRVERSEVTECSIPRPLESELDVVAVDLVRVRDSILVRVRVLISRLADTCNRLD